MDFRILGPVEVMTGGKQLRLGGPRQRALLAYLLLHANETVAADRLLDELWFDAPSGGLAALQTQVSRLRRILVDRIATAGSGYSIRVKPGELDLERFRALLAEAGAAEEPRTRSRLLRDADALSEYRETRRALDEDLGLQPGPALRELEQAILRHDPSLTAVSVPAARAAPESTEPSPARRRRRIVAVAAVLLLLL